MHGAVLIEANLGGDVLASGSHVGDVGDAMQCTAAVGPLDEGVWPVYTASP